MNDVEMPDSEFGLPLIVNELACSADLEGRDAPRLGAPAMQGSAPLRLAGATPGGGVRPEPERPTDR